MDYNFTSSKRIMAQLLRRTKKCCVKLLQKLSFADASSTNSTPCHQSSQKCCHRNMYAPQINRTPTRHRVAPSPEHGPASNGFRHTSTKSAEHKNNNNNNNQTHIFDDFHHSNQSLHSQTGHLSKLFRIRKSASSTKRQPSTKMTATQQPPKNTNRMNNAKHLMGASAANANGQHAQKKRFNHSPTERSMSSTTGVAVLAADEEQIIFTENRIYAAASAAAGTSTTANEQRVNHNENTSTPNKQHHKHTFALTSVGCLTKGSVDIHANSINRSTSAAAVTATATNSKIVKKEIVFEKVKLSRSNGMSPNASSIESPVRACHPIIQCKTIPRFGFESNSGSPINHHYSEYDNLSETFYHSEHSAPTPNSSRIQPYDDDDDTWDFLAGSHADAYQNVVLSPSHPPLSNRRLFEIHYEAAISSRRSSISTAETWIDDETFDNSFNEELEKRCATYH